MSEAMDSVLFSLSKAFCSPLAVFVQIQVCFFSFFLFQIHPVLFLSYNADA
jgi:hypothetical protein